MLVDVGAPVVVIGLIIVGLSVLINAYIKGPDTHDVASDSLIAAWKMSRDGHTERTGPYPPSHLSNSLKSNESTRLDSTRLDSTRLDSTRLDSTRPADLT